MLWRVRGTALRAARPKTNLRDLGSDGEAARAGGPTATALFRLRIAGKAPTISCIYWVYTVQFLLYTISVYVLYPEYMDIYGIVYSIQLISTYKKTVNMRL